MLPSMTASATARMVRRRSIEVFWIQRKASGSLKPVLGLKQAFGSVEQLADFQPLPQRADLVIERADLGEPADRHLDGRQRQIGLGNGLTR